MCKLRPAHGKGTETSSSLPYHPTHDRLLRTRRLYTDKLNGEMHTEHPLIEYYRGAVFMDKASHIHAHMCAQPQCMQGSTASPMGPSKVVVRALAWQCVGWQYVGIACAGGAVAGQGRASNTSACVPTCVHVLVPSGRIQTAAANQGGPKANAGAGKSCSVHTST